MAVTLTSQQRQVAVRALSKDFTEVLSNPVTTVSLLEWVLDLLLLSNAELKVRLGAHLDVVRADIAAARAALPGQSAAATAAFNADDAAITATKTTLGLP